MPPRRVPPLNALKAFEAVARHESVTRASAELHVTQSAVSHQIKALENALGVKLFERMRPQLGLTEAGGLYFSVVRDALDRIAIGTERLTQRQREKNLTVSTSADFAAKWLACRVGRFADQHPDIDLTIMASARHADFAGDGVDVAVRHGDGRWPGLHAVRLCTEELFPVCSPALLAGGPPLKTPADLLKHPLLRLRDWSTWERWFQAAGLADARGHGTALNSASMLLDAAASGQGVALARTTLASFELITGRLMCPMHVSLPLATSYWFVCPKTSFDLPKIAAFRKWLLREAATDQRKLKSVLNGPARKPAARGALALP
jgi:LysR family glycine cleavage system transcriptional activator